MQRYQNGEPGGAAAFDDLYGRYKDRTWRYFRRQLNDDPARDCQQELWMKLIERRDTYSPQGKFDAYLFSMAHSVMVDAQRKHLRVVDRATDASIDIDTLRSQSGTEPERADTLSRAIGALKNAITRLPISQRNTFVLHQESGLSYAAIAEATDTTAETVKSRLRYARNKLTQELRDRLGADFHQELDPLIDHATDTHDHPQSTEESGHVHL